MALLNCVDCGDSVSDRAPTCPKCGAPRTIAGTASPAPALAPSTNPRRKTHPITLIVALGLLVVVGWSSLSSYHKSQLPALPMQVQSRPAILGKGLVILFENQTDQPLSVSATLGHPATNFKRVYEIYTGPRGTKSIGSAEGWIGQSGDMIALENNQYQRWSGSIR